MLCSRCGLEPQPTHDGVGECIIALRNRIQRLELEIAIAARGIRATRESERASRAIADQRGDAGAPVREWREESARCRERLARLEPET